MLRDETPNRRRAFVEVPSDRTDLGVGHGHELRLGGRVVRVGTDDLDLADAFRQLRLHCAPAIVDALSVGDLVVLLVGSEQGQWEVHAVEEQRRFEPPRGDSEWARLVWSNKACNLAVRSRVRRAIGEWLDGRGFLEVETPTWLPVPGLDSEIDAVAAERGWLVTSPELCMKRLLVGGIPRVYQFAKCFRRDELGARHEPEFTMLEWYRSFSDLEQVLEDTEAIVTLAAHVAGVGTSLVAQGRRIRLEPPFARLSVAEAFRLHAGISDVTELVERDRDRYFRLFVECVEPALAEYDVPVFLHGYPAAEAALARLCPNDARWAERAELYVAGVELCNAYSELDSPSEQRQRFEAELSRRQDLGRPTYPLDERFLAALEQGMPTASGNALGFDRLVLLLVGAQSIGDVMAFPRAEL